LFSPSSFQRTGSTSDEFQDAFRAACYRRIGPAVGPGAIFSSPCRSDICDFVKKKSLIDLDIKGVTRVACSRWRAQHLHLLFCQYQISKNDRCRGQYERQLAIGEEAEVGAFFDISKKAETATARLAANQRACAGKQENPKQPQSERLRCKPDNHNLADTPGLISLPRTTVLAHPCQFFYLFAHTSRDFLSFFAFEDPT